MRRGKAAEVGSGPVEVYVVDLRAVNAVQGRFTSARRVGTTIHPHLADSKAALTVVDPQLLHTAFPWASIALVDAASAHGPQELGRH